MNFDLRMFQTLMCYPLAAITDIAYQALPLIVVLNLVDSFFQISQKIVF